MMTEYNHLRNEVVTNIRKYQQDYYTKKISPDIKPQNIWKAVNESLGKYNKNLNYRMTYHPMTGITTLLLLVQNYLENLQIARIQLGIITPVSISSKFGFQQ